MMRDWQDDGAPDYRYLSDRGHVSSKDRLCTSCDEPIKAGERYRAVAMICDGKFERHTVHSGICPKFVRIMAGMEG